MNPRAVILRRAKLSGFAKPASRLFSFPLPGRTEDKPARFASTLAHEVRNPLTTINLAVDMLNLTGIDDEQRQYLEIIMRGSGRIKDLINALLLSGQADEVMPEYYSLHRLLEEVLIMATDRIVLKNITVRRDYMGDDRFILMDKEKMKIALTNIVVNAIDAMPEERPELNLVTRSTDGLCILEIRDNGIGISKENLKQIFNPYFTNKPGGMGLGLSATISILRANHTRVDVQSEQGIGTCFVLSFDSM
ncbi:MAG: ATP-binding protein [Puia sp.]|nr:ATP-binding protein [Puia sp.]